MTNIQIESIRSQLDTYINQQYSHWLKYAQYHSNRSRLNIDPTEALNASLLCILERSESKISELLHTTDEGITSLDLLVKRIIKINIISPRSQLRYICGGQCTFPTSEIDSNHNHVILMEEHEDFDIIDHLELVKEAITKLNLTDKEKEIFNWKFFQGNSLRKWHGEESRYKALQIYNEVFEKIRVRIQSNSII